MALEEVDLETGVATAMHVGAVFADGSILRFEFPRMSIEEGTGIVRALEADLSPRPGS